MTIDEQLDKAISKYDFEHMKELLRQGATPDDMILHRIINRERLEDLKYVLFSPELPAHCNINYAYTLFGEGAAFVYASSCDAHKIIEFLLNDERMTGKFNFKNITFNAVRQAFDGGSWDALNILMHHEKTREYCKVKENYKELIQFTDSRPVRDKFIENLMINLEDIELAAKFADACNQYQSLAQKTIQMRIFHEELKDDLCFKEKSKKIKI